MRMSSMSIFHLYCSAIARIIFLQGQSASCFGKRSWDLMRNLYMSASSYLQRTALMAGLVLATLGAAKADEVTCEPAKAVEKYPGLAGKTIKIGQDGESVPFSMRDPKDFNHLIGLDADLARATFACVGVPIEFKTGAWSGLIPATMSGQVDLMWDTLLYTPERAKKMDFVAYMNSATAIIVPKGNPKKIKAVDDLCGLTGTTNLGTTQEAMLRAGSDKCVAAGKKPIDIITS